MSVVSTVWEDLCNSQMHKLHTGRVFPSVQTHCVVCGIFYTPSHFPQESLCGNVIEPSMFVWCSIMYVSVEMYIRTYIARIVYVHTYVRMYVC